MPTKKQLKLLVDNTVLQGILTVIIWGTMSYLYATGAAVPDTLLSAGSIILGFYFHGAAQAALKRKEG